MVSEFPAHLIDHVVLLAQSFSRLTGRTLVQSSGPEDLARRAWEAGFALVSHGTEDDPVFNYANPTALRLFEMGWDDFTRLPSRLSAEPVGRRERDALLQRVSEYGYIDDYTGVRISATGKRFVIRDAVVWNVIDREGRNHGQAAMFAHWNVLTGPEAVSSALPDK